jgi:hypothetical protein
MIDAIVFAVIGLAIVAPVLFYLYRHLRPIGRLLKNAGVIRPPESGGNSVYERANLRLGVALIGANVLALLLISIVGFSQLGMDWSRLRTGEKAQPSTTALEELLRSRLPDQETLKRQHQEVVDAIREALPAPLKRDQHDELTESSALRLRVEGLERDKQTNSDSIYGIVALAVAGCGLLGAWMLAKALFVEGNLLKKIVKIAEGLALIGVSVLGGANFKAEGSLFKSVETFFKLDLHVGGDTTPAKPQPLEPQQVDIHVNLDLQSANYPAPSIDCGDGNAFRIGPFDAGAITLSEMETTKLAQLAATWAAPQSPGHIVAIMLIGSADKRSLKPKTAENFNSNQGLAQARIRLVRKILEPALAKDKSPTPILESYAGPVNTGAKLPVGDLASDRAVQICVFWSPKPEPR